MKTTAEAIATTSTRGILVVLLFVATLIQTQLPVLAAAEFPQPSALPPSSDLPDPLVMLDGRRVTTREQWINERRPELLALFQHYMYGKLPPSPKTVTGKIERQDSGALGGKATLQEVTITLDSPELPPIYLMLVVPNHRPGPAPVVLSLNYFGNHTLVRDPAVRLSTSWMPERGAGVVNHRATEASRGTWVDIWNIEYLIDRGYAVATFYNGDVDPDDVEERGIETYFKKLDPNNDCATVAAWAWGLQRAVDYLVTLPDVDQRRIVVTGHSRLGKAALVAAAFDERIALAIPHQAGSGGSAPSRTGIKPPAAPDAPPTAPGQKSRRLSASSTRNSPIGSTRASRNLTINRNACRSIRIPSWRCARRAPCSSPMDARTHGSTRADNSRSCERPPPFTDCWGQATSMHQHFRRMGK